ncbi:phage exclusion protein Lit family protein [Mesorhizobium sp. B2-4-8]|uniref:phage exclusion protein Lit family protein n=1 Tax=Mesorhizobium sp. B2-4-8 TaxID=2589941 RepID=UPI0011294994|nr:phage exclusion protein Lit family protein [Mesorhizobium sp. B2-4-8]TPL35576.1 peptidase U49, Lit peptidase [Mesorhizobium sp. B2-4-8]
MLGFSAWRAIEVYAPALTLAMMTGATLEAALNMDHERGQFEQDYKQRVARAKALLDVADTSEIEWPEDVPYPTDDRDSLANVEQASVFDLVALGLAFALLHEFKHVQARAENSEQAKAEEEMACDTWARDFMTSGIAQYAQSHGHAYAQVAQKRAMGIALAAVTIHAMTPRHAHWGNEDYPPIGERLMAMIGGYNLPAGSPFWLFTACLLVALMRQDNRRLDYKGSSFQDYAMVLLSELR